jgi:integrase
MGKRAAHEGSVRQRRDGTWEARIQVGGVRVSRYGATRAEVVAKLHALQSTPVLRSTTTVILSEWVGQWIAERDLRPSARSTYERVLRPILRDLGHVTLAKLNPLMLSLQFSLLKERGVGARRVQLAHGYLKGCLAHAVEMGLIATNPMSGVKRPRWVPKTKRYWTFEETTRFLSTCQSSSLRYAPLFLLIATTGLRISEALALEDGSSPTLTISGAVVWEQSRGYAAGEVKTPTSRRQVTVPEAGVGALSSIPFRTSGGKVPRPAILYATLATLCAQAQVPPVSPHALRHIHAALAYKATGDAYAVQKRLGHASVTTTMGLYGFGLSDEDETGAALDTLLGSGGRGGAGDTPRA